MIPVYTDVTAAIRIHLSDTEVAAGQVWTDASGKCDPYIQQAYEELYKGFEGAAVQNVQRTLYGVLPAFTSYINPKTFGANNFSEPVLKPLWERDGVTFPAVTITAAVPGSTGPDNPFVTITTATPHGWTSGEMVLVFGLTGLSDDVNDQWAVTVVDATNATLNGCTAIVTSGPVAGFATNNTTNWNEVLPRRDFINYPQQPGGQLSNYEWVNGAFRVFPATVPRQIKMVFYLSAQAPNHTTPPLSGGVSVASFGFDGSLGFLSYRAAALAAQDRGYSPAKFQSLNTTALGPSQSHQDWGGLFGMLMRSKARSAARNRVILPPYRNPRRNAGYVIRY